MRFADIPPFTRSANYRINVSWSYLEKWIEEMNKETGIDLSPDYQRDHVWTETQEIRYIEFVLRGGQTGREIYFNCPTWNTCSDVCTPLELVDGKQRLKAVRRFLNNEIPAFGYLYKEFEDTLRLVKTDFIIYINDLQTKAEVLQWYLDMNSGGTVHSEEELTKVKTMLNALEMK
jgi:hypothetical protein